MNQPNSYEDAQAVKELLDITSDYHKTQSLLNEMKWDELYAHIQDVMKKYPLEVVAYNFMNPQPPQSLQENAINCMKFLRILAIQKGAKDISDRL
ncbi:MAG: hypothetical protein IJK52_09670 [Oscillospiraceae bacterium]|nr:hypothetical protein [Oscillospiraceae bacterium]